MNIYGVVGWKNSGKTTLVEKVVAEITERGFTVSTVKHAHHAFDIDHEGKDSWRHRQAGAAQVLVASSQRWALMSELRGAPEPPLDKLVAHLDPVDLVLVEGFKAHGHPKLEAYRREAGLRRARKARARETGEALSGDLAEGETPPLIAAKDPTVRAVASDCPLPGLDLPRFDLDDIDAVASFILSDCGLAP